MRRAAAILLVFASAGAGCGACMRAEDKAAKKRLFTPGEDKSSFEGFDWADPRAVLSVTAADAASRLGAFEWEGKVSWSVQKAGQKLAIRERHVLRQAANGDFEITADLDPDLGKGSETGYEIIWANRTTYAHGKWAPWRERPTDRGRDAMRYREEGFGLLADLGRLYGASLLLRPAGESSHLSRPARRLSFALGPDTAEAAEKEKIDYPEGGPDTDTRRRLAFLKDRVPVKLEGEILADAATGVPMKVELRGAFKVKDDPSVTAQVELVASVKSLGKPGVAPPKEPQPDERKPRGVMSALDTAGLKRVDGGIVLLPRGGEDEGGEGDEEN